MKVEGPDDGEVSEENILDIADAHFHPWSMLYLEQAGRTLWLPIYPSLDLLRTALRRKRMTAIVNLA
jgi:hypothetical protein